VQGGGTIYNKKLLINANSRIKLHQRGGRGTLGRGQKRWCPLATKKDIGFQDEIGKSLENKKPRGALICLSEGGDFSNAGGKKTIE